MNGAFVKCIKNEFCTEIIYIMNFAPKIQVKDDGYSDYVLLNPPSKTKITE